MKITFLLILSVFNYFLLKGQEVTIVEYQGNCDTVIKKLYLQDSVDAPFIDNNDTVTFQAIKKQFYNCMKVIPDSSNYELFIGFSFEIDNQGLVTLIDKFRYSKTLFDQLSSFNTVQLLNIIPSKWNAAVLKTTKEAISFQVNVWITFNNKEMRISFLNKENRLFLPEIRL